MKMKNMWNLVVGVVILGCVAMAQDEGGPRPPEGGPRPPRGERMEQRMLPPGGGFASRADDLVILMNRLKKENPDEFARLDKLRQTNHGQYMAEIRRLLPRENKAIQAMMENERNCRLLAHTLLLLL